jgi:hypothetical protein
MRHVQFGIFDAETAEIDGMFCSSARSELSFADNTSNQVSSINNYNPTGISGNADVGYIPGGGEPTHAIALVKTQIGLIKSILGQISVLVRCDFGMVSEETETNQLRVYKMYKDWDDADTNTRYKDVSLSTPWYQDTYGPFPAQDRESIPTYEGPAGEQLTAEERAFMTITPLMAQALRDNETLRFMLWHKGNQTGWRWKHTQASKRPTYDFYFFYPIEFYESLASGDIDYSSTIQEAEDGHYYIGAVERDQTGTPVKGWVRNYEDQTNHIELFDDHPEWPNPPVQQVGSGTGQLDFPVLSETAVSQKYTLQFYSATEYEVLAQADGDNPVDLHGQYDADATWRGVIGADKTFPSPSGLTIKATAWQPGTLVNDEFEFTVRGNTTDTDWPADSNDQVEVARDDGGSPETASWRPCTGQRIKSTASVSVDGASKFFPLRRIDTSLWIVGDPAFIQDADKIDEGTVSSVQDRSLADETHTGSGLDDCDISGNFNGNADHDYRVVIDATGATDTFSWSRTGDATYIETGVDCSTTPYHLENGVYVVFGAITGHTIADRWDSAALTWGITVGSLTPGANVYGTGAIVGTTLPIRSIAKAIYSVVTAASGAGESPESRLYLEDTDDFTQGDTVFVQQVLNPAIYEHATIATGGVQSTYLDLTAALTNSYDAGDFATKEGSGEAPFGRRPV